HRKSIEAADKLKDCDSDGESNHQSEHSCSNASVNSNPNHKLANERVNLSHSPLTPITSHSHSPHSSAAVIYNPVMNNGSGKSGSFKEDLRTSSIAALRAKAIEHSAKVHTLVSNRSASENTSLFTQASPSHTS